MTITGGSALPKDDIDRMMREAEEYAEEDRKRRESAEARNQADGLVYSTEKFLADNGDKVPADVTRRGDRCGRRGQDGPRGRRRRRDHAHARRHLATVSQKMGQAMYAAKPRPRRGASAGGPTGAADDSSTSDDDVVDAEIVDEAHERMTGVLRERPRPPSTTRGRRSSATSVGSTRRPARCGGGGRSGCPPRPRTARRACASPDRGTADDASSRAQLAERTADLQRLQAEYANYRRRVERDRQAVGEQALAAGLRQPAAGARRHRPGPRARRGHRRVRARRRRARGDAGQAGPRALRRRRASRSTRRCTRP